MVSMNLNPSQAQGFYLDPSGMPLGVNLPGLTHMSSQSAIPTNSSAEDPSKKVRKPYTITKSRESWTEPEHDKFLEAIQLFDRDWKKIEAFVGSKTVIQIRSHAQKYFMKVQKNGSNERVPPPRPKRKASHPYPQKASKMASTAPQPVATYQVPSTVCEPGYPYCSESSSVVTNQPTSTLIPNPTWNYNDEAVMLGTQTALPPGCCSSGSESAPNSWPAEGASDMNPANPTKVMPDFAQVYSFLGSVFDPDACGQLEKLKMMDPIDVRTVVLLMRNLSANLTNPEFEEFRKLVSSNGVESGGITSYSPMIPAI